MKKWLDLLATVWIGLSTHKLRSFLTILGIVIGVAAVITMMSIGKGAEASIISRIQGLGSNLITISPGSTTAAGGVRSEFGSSQTLTMEGRYGDLAGSIWHIGSSPNLLGVTPGNRRQHQPAFQGYRRNPRVYAGIQLTDCRG